MPGQGRRAGRGRGPPASASPPAPGPPGGASCGTVRSASWVGDHDHRQDQQAQRQARRPEGRPERQRLEAERPHEQRQAEDAVDDRRHAGQVGDVGLDDPPDPARRGVLLEEDRRADADRDRRRPRPGRAARGCRRSPTRNPAIAGSRRLRLSREASQQRRRARRDVARSSYQGLSRRAARAPPIRTEPSRTESTTTPEQVASKQATPKSGPQTTAGDAGSERNPDRGGSRSLVDLAVTPQHQPEMMFSVSVISEQRQPDGEQREVLGRPVGRLAAGHLRRCRSVIVSIEVSGLSVICGRMPGGQHHGHRLADRPADRPG